MKAVPVRGKQVFLAVGLVVALLIFGGPASQVAAQSDASPVAVGSPISGDVLAAWTQFGVDGGLHARAVVQGECPAIAVDGVAATMATRAEQSDAFPVTVCEYGLAEGAVDIRVGELALPTLRDDVSRVLAIGDTGCRINDEIQQGCNDPAEWPFSRVAEQGAAWEPDLVIHAGDYLYREAACPEGNEACAGSPWGDTWDTWYADILGPAQPLLAAAPWVFVRGNHESCARNWEGWFRLLDPGPYNAECRTYTDPYLLTIGDQTAVVIDAAVAQDVNTDPESTAAYEAQFAQVEALAGDDSVWLLSHKAFWSLGTDWEGGALEWTTATFIEATSGTPPEAIDLVISGHVHMAQALQFTEESGRPFELITGNGGTLLEAYDDGVFAGADLDDDALVEGFSYQAHGFLGLERVDGGWVATMHQIDGPALASCLLVGKQVTCMRFTEP